MKTRDWSVLQANVSGGRLLRRQLLFITPAGRALYAQYIPALRARERAMLACLTRPERKAFERLLDKLAGHVPHWAAPGKLSVIRPSRHGRSQTPGSLLRTRTRQISRANTVTVTANGPRMSPDGPNRMTPPTTEMNAGMV